MSLENEIFYGPCEMFWNTPELIERLLPYLDAESTKCLAEAHDLTQETLLTRDSIWNKLLRRTFPYSKNTRWDEDKLEEETLMPKARLLAQILKMASDPKSLQLELLRVICEKLPPFVEDSSAFGTPLDNVRVRCPCSKRHRVAPLGFLLLEQVEATLGSAEQIVDLVQTNLLEASARGWSGSMVCRVCWSLARSGATA